MKTALNARVLDEAGISGKERRLLIKEAGEHRKHGRFEAAGRIYESLHRHQMAAKTYLGGRLYAEVERMCGEDKSHMPSRRIIREACIMALKDGDMEAARSLAKGLQESRIRSLERVQLSCLIAIASTIVLAPILHMPITLLGIRVERIRNEMELRAECELTRMKQAFA